MEFLTTFQQLISALIGFAVAGFITNWIEHKKDARNRAHERKTLAGALMAEIKFFQPLIEGRVEDFTEMPPSVFEEVKRTRKLPIQARRVYDATVSRIGDLDPKIAVPVIEFFARLDDVALRGENLKTSTDSLDDLRRFYAELNDVRKTAVEALETVVTN